MTTEKEFLSAYKIGDFDRPSVAADLAIFRMRATGGDNFRKDPESKLSLLLIRRGEHPFLGRWALPGGFLRMDETVEACALREAREETGITPTAMLYLGVFSAVDRDPRGRIISNAFTCILNRDAVPKAGTDAAEARWFDVAFTESDDGECTTVLTSGDLLLRTRLTERKSLCGDVLVAAGPQPLAFDHAVIVSSALKQLKARAAHFETIFDFLPPKFTLYALQNVQETLTGVAAAPANFRRKISDYVVETDEYTQGAGHRPAELYRRK